MAHARVIRDNIETLLRCTNVNVQIIACLKAYGGLTEDQVSDIVAEQSLRTRCVMLYNWMQTSIETYKCFVQVMEENQQEHVSNLLKGKTNGLYVPLSSVTYQRLDRIKPKLMRTIYLNEELTSNLKSKQAISETDYQDIKYGKTQPYEQNWALLTAIQRRSEHSLRCLKDALLETHQSDAADCLERGDIIAMHLHTNRPEIEGQLSTAISRDISAEFASEYSTISELSEHGLHLVGARPDKSILLYFYCSETLAATVLAKSYSSGLLKSLLDSMLNRLLDRTINQAMSLAIGPSHLETSLSIDVEEALLIEEVTGLDVFKTKKHPLEKEIDARFELKALRDALQKKGRKSFAMHEDEGRYIISGRQSSSSSQSKDTTLLEEFSVSKRSPVVAMTLLMDELYVIHSRSSTIEIFSCTTNYRCKTRQVTLVTDAKDIAACSPDNRIYILNTLTDRISMEIVRIAKASDSVDYWKVPCDSRHIHVFGVSIFLSLVLRGNPQIIEYTCKGSQLRTIALNLPKQVSDFQAIRVKTGRFVCIAVDGSSTKRELLAVNNDGTVLHSIEVDPNRRDLSSREEDHNFLTSDNNDCALVSDKRASKVWVFDPNLERRMELVSAHHRLVNPDGIALDDSGERLFALNKSKGLVQVFRISRRSSETKAT